jgi:predicted nicotinamide N-methyase
MSNESIHVSVCCLSSSLQLCTIIIWNKLIEIHHIDDDDGSQSLFRVVMMKDEAPQQLPDRSSNSRALIVHPLFKDRHPIYQCFGSGKQYEKFQYIAIPGFALPFVVHQNFISSHENLGSVAWEAGISAAGYVADWLKQQQQQQHQEASRRCRVLELGCGTAALVSQSAALCGAYCVMTDLPDVLEWAKLNAKSNCVNQWKASPDYYQLAMEESTPGSVSPLLSARTLRWGEPSDLEQLEKEEQWKAFDIVVAADCMYATNENPDLQAKLLFTLERLLANGRTKLFISYQLRTGQERIFVDQILPSAFPHYVVEEVNHNAAGGVRDAGVYSMVWFRPRSGSDMEFAPTF